jgi:hypothetical protein
LNLQSQQLHHLKKLREKKQSKVMNSDIYNASKEKMQAYCKCKWNGKPQNPLDQLVLNKKLTSYNLRIFCRTEVAQRRIKERQELIEAKTMNDKLSQTNTTATRKTG